MPLTRRTRWTLAAGAALAAAALGVALYGGWRPFGADVPVLAGIPGDVDAACRADLAALRTSPVFAEPAIRVALADAADLAGADILDPMLGDEIALATRDGSWLAVLRTAGFFHGARLGVARLFLTTRGDGPVLEATTPGDDDVWVARLGRTWIVSDDEELAAESYACLAGTSAPVTSRLDLGGALGTQHTLTVWVSDDASTHAVDAVRRVLGDAAATIAASLPSPDSAVTLDLDAPASPHRCDAALAWRCSDESETKVTLTVELHETADALESEAEKAPPPAPRNEPVDRVRFTIEASKDGFTGDALSAEVTKRMQARAAARVQEDADAARTTAHRMASLLRAFGRLEASLVVHEGAARLTLAVSK